MGVKVEGGAASPNPTLPGTDGAGMNPQVWRDGLQGDPSSAPLIPSGTNRQGLGRSLSKSRERLQGSAHTVTAVQG